jgi:hypothetical protein
MDWPNLSRLIRHTQMHQYSIQFSTTALDESRLRDVLEREFQISGIVIVRTSSTSVVDQAKPQKAISSLESAIKELLSDGRPWRRKRILEKSQEFGSGQEIYTAVRKLESRGEIKKARHGVYLVANADQPSDNEIPPMNNMVDRPSYEKVLELLREPKSAIQLQEGLGVSRQRVDQIVKSLMRKGIAHRLEASGERGAYIYILSDPGPGALVLTRNPKFHDSRVRLLSVLSPDVLARAYDVAVAAALPFAKIGEYIDQLAARGFVSAFKLGRHKYVAITPRGVQHPQYDKSSPKVSSADIIADFGETRIRFIELLSVLRSAPTVDLTYAMPNGYFDDEAQKAGNIVQRLEKAGIIEKFDTSPGKQPNYCLAEMGKFVSSVIKRIRVPPAEQELIQNIASRRSEFSERLRSAAARKGSAQSAASPTQTSIVMTLQKFGPLSTKQLNESMDVKFSNPGSIYLALQTLTKQGKIRRLRLPDHKVYHWELVSRPVDTNTITN